MGEQSGSDHGARDQEVPDAESDELTDDQVDGVSGGAMPIIGAGGNGYVVDSLLGSGGKGGAGGNGGAGGAGVIGVTHQ